MRALPVLEGLSYEKKMCTVKDHSFFENSDGFSGQGEGSSFLKEL